MRLAVAVMLGVALVATGISRVSAEGEGSLRPTAGAKKKSKAGCYNKCIAKCSTVRIRGCDVGCSHRCS